MCYYFSFLILEPQNAFVQLRTVMKFKERKEQIPIVGKHPHSLSKITVIK